MTPDQKKVMEAVIRAAKVATHKEAMIGMKTLTDAIANGEDLKELEPESYKNTWIDADRFVDSLKEEMEK